MTAVLAGLVAACDRSPREKAGVAPPAPMGGAAFDDYLYQYSVMDALLAGVYDGDLSFGELKRHGDFGIGGFNRLDGELLMVDGDVFRMRFDGGIEKVPDQEKTPVAFVKFFRPERTIRITGRNLTYEQVQQRLDRALNRNEIHALRLSGSFATIQARAPAPAERPYLPLARYLAEGGQRDFSFTETKGTAVGFRLPSYMARTNVPGYHLHFISDDRTSGGHVFDFAADEIVVEIDRAAGYIVNLSTNPSFLQADLDKDRQKELEDVE